MKMLSLAAAIISLAFACPALAQQVPAPGPLTIQTDQPGPVINRDIFGQFAEHLGTGIYGGVWVGKNSRIPNVRGIRSDAVNTFEEPIAVTPRVFNAMAEGGSLVLRLPPRSVAVVRLEP